MTKTSIFGQSEVKQEEKKPIKFVKYISKSFCEFQDARIKPIEWGRVMLLNPNYTDDLDLMWAYDGDPNYGVLYLGHWNDGIVK